MIFSRAGFLQAQQFAERKAHEKKSGEKL